MAQVENPQTLPPSTSMLDGGPTGGKRSLPSERPVLLDGHHVTINRDDYSGARLMLADGRVGLLLLQDARGRVVERVLGVPREQSGLVTLIALGMVAGAAYERTQRMLNIPGKASVTDAALGIAATREILYDVAGPASRGTPLFGTLVTIAVAGGLLGPVAGASLRAVKRSSRHAGLAFHHRYGHLIGPSRRNAGRVAARISL